MQDNFRRMLHANFLNSVMSKSKAIYSTFVKTISLGAEVNFPLILEDYNNIHMGFGLKSLERIEKDLDIMVVPINSGFHGKELRHFTNDDHRKIVREMCDRISLNFFAKNDLDYIRMYQTQMIVMQLLLNFYNEDSELHNFSLSLPLNDMTHMMFIGKNVFDQISSKNLVNLYFDQRSYQRMIYDILMHQSIYRITEEEFYWAFNNVRSRKFSFINDKCLEREDYKEGKMSMEDSYEILLPIFDYLNHDFNPNCMAVPYYDEDTKKSYLKLISTRDIKENEQLFVNYGEMSNIVLLNKYGFVIENNQINEASILLFEEIEEETSTSNIPKFCSLSPENNKFQDILMNEIEFKLQLLDKNKIDPNIFNFAIKIFNNRFELNVLKVLRIMLLDKNDMIDKDKIINYDFSKEFSPQNEKNLIDFMMNTLKYYYENLKNTNFDRKISDIGRIDSKDKYCLRNVYIIEKEEKELIEKNIQYFQKRLTKYL